jgi:hypothetical protein
MSENIYATNDKKYRVIIPGALGKLRECGLNRAEKKYGAPLPETVKERLDIDMPTGIRYRISNRLMADNTAFYRLSGINPITGNPIYRNSFNSNYPTFHYFLRIR